MTENTEHRPTPPTSMKFDLDTIWLKPTFTEWKEAVDVRQIYRMRSQREGGDTK